MLAYAADQRHPVVDLLLRDQPVDRSIDAEDEMLLFARQMHEGDEDAAIAAYFRDGASVASAIRQLAVWHAGGLDKLGAMLDFASGYGRVTRFMVRELAPERLWVSDIYPQAVAFQQATFGVHGLPSAPDPAAFDCPQRFDLVFVTSLFTHLPEATFRGWLERLLSVLTPKGLLVFSVHDESLLPPGEEMPTGGLRFAPSSESRSLDPEAYGSTWVSESFVRRAVAALAPQAVCVRLPRALGHYQDLFLVSLDPAADSARLSFDPGPGGFLERAAIAGGERLTVSGWAAQAGGNGSVGVVRAWLDGRLLGELRRFGQRPDVAQRVGSSGLEFGWQFDGTLTPTTPHGSSYLVVEAETATGVRGSLYAGTLAQALRRSVQGDLDLTQSLRRHENETSALAVRRLELDNEALRARMAAMEASRFWRLRNAWFAVKRALGVSRET
jgi:SAM-dependent methyltransferase